MALIMAIKLNKVALKPEKKYVIFFNPQPNVYLKKSEEMRLGLHHSRSISLLSLRNFFQSCAAIVLVSTSKKWLQQNSRYAVKVIAKGGFISALQL